MRLNKIIALALACGISSAAYALEADPFDMGNVQVVGKDAQSADISQTNYNITFGMTDKSIPVPDLTPEMESLTYKPMTEKPTIANIHKENKNEFSAALGLGNKKANEIILNGKGSNENYNADVIILRESRDGYKSNVDTERTGIKARVSSKNDEITTISGGAEIFDDKFALRSTDNAINTGMDANAKLSNDNKRIWINGDSTLENGAFLKAYAKIDVLNREVENEAGFRDGQDVKSYRIGANYKNRIDDKTKANATLDLKREELDSDIGKNISFTKFVAAGGVTHEFSSKTEAGAGIKALKLKGTDKLSPYFNVTYRPDEAWKLSLGYEEDLGNDSLETVFLPKRYVDSLNLDYKASKLKTFKTSVDYRTPEGNHIGLDLFSQKENNAIEYFDLENFNNQKVLSSHINFTDAKRQGITLRGEFTFEKYFTISLKGTAQSPKCEHGGYMSYEPKKILDVGLNYTKDKFMIDFTRRAEYDRKAYVGSFGGNIAYLDASDYSRSDLAVRYKINDKFTGYLKIRDLYDEAKKIRKDVSEEGRLTMAGVEMHF